MHNGSNDADSCKDVSFWGFIDISVYLMGQILPKTDFEGVNRRFPVKHVKQLNFHIFETTASIATKFHTVIKTTTYPS